MHIPLLGRWLGRRPQEVKRDPDLREEHEEIEQMRARLIDLQRDKQLDNFRRVHTDEH